MKYFFSVLLIAFMLAGIMSAQSKFCQARVWEAGGSFAIANASPIVDGQGYKSITTLNLQPYFGYFITDNFQLGVMPSLEVTSNVTTSGMLNVFVVPTYYYPLRELGIFPYVHALGGISAYSPSDVGSPNSMGRDTTRSGLSWGVGAGVKYQIANSVLLNFGFDYIQYTLNFRGAEKRWGFNRFSTQAGFTVILN